MELSWRTTHGAFRHIQKEAIEITEYLNSLQCMVTLRHTTSPSEFEHFARNYIAALRQRSTIISSVAGGLLERIAQQQPDDSQHDHAKRD